jgi:UDP-2,3-diacylglucosamine pyrophosphatase LpxH
VTRDSDGSRAFRALFISDVHLGTKGCQADRLLDFLREYDAETIYLVGDIVDGWQLRSGWYWPPAHNDVVQKLLRKARKGARIVYLPGNHDEFLRDYYGSHFGGVEVAESAIHRAADGRRYLVLHGDLFDIVIKHARWLALLGDHAYEAAICINTMFNTVRRCLGLTYWSLSQWAKLKVKNAVSYIGEYERTLVEEAWPGDVVGIHDRGSLRIGDCLAAVGSPEFEAIPPFSPEHFSRVHVPDPLRRKHLDKALLELSEEGAIQVFFTDGTTGPAPVVGAVGPLQFDVLLHRLEHEYGVGARLEPMPYRDARWVRGPDAEIRRVAQRYDCALVRDRHHRPLLLFRSEWVRQSVEEREPDLELRRVALD